MPQSVKDPLEMQKTQVRLLGWEDPLDKGMATYSSVLAWRIPSTVQDRKSGGGEVEDRVVCLVTLIIVCMSF